MFKKLLHVAGTTILCAGIFSNAQALPFNQISQVYFFGDNLTDSGFNDLWSRPYPLPKGKAPTLTTYGGYTWAQYIARDIKGFVLPIYTDSAAIDTITNNSIFYVPSYVSSLLKGVNYAAAGSTTNAVGYNETWAPSLHQQVDKYLSDAGQAADPNAVYFIWSGANDLMRLLDSPGSPAPMDYELIAAAHTTAINIANEVARLSAHGAKRIVVFSWLNLAVTPVITQFAGRYPALPGQMQTLAFLASSMLNTELGKVISTYGTKILYIDTYSIFNDVTRSVQTGQTYVVAGQTFKFINYTDPACDMADSAIYCPMDAPNNYIYADIFNISDMMHRVIAMQVETRIQNWQ